MSRKWAVIEQLNCLLSRVVWGCCWFNYAGIITAGTFCWRKWCSTGIDASFFFTSRGFETSQTEVVSMWLFMFGSNAKTLWRVEKKDSYVAEFRCLNLAPMSLRTDLIRAKTSRSCSDKQVPRESRCNERLSRFITLRYEGLPKFVISHSWCTLTSRRAWKWGHWFKMAAACEQTTMAFRLRFFMI